MGSGTQDGVKELTLRKFEKDYRLRESDDVLSRENAIHLDLDMRLDAVEQVAEAIKDGNREDVNLLIEKIDQTVSPLTQAMKAVIEEQGKGFTPDRIAETADKRFTSEREIGALHTEMQNLNVQAERNKAQIEARVADALDDLVNGAPGTLDTLKELAAAIGNDKDFGASIAAQLARKFDKSGGSITGETTFEAIARFQAGMTIEGDLSTTGRLVVGDSADGSWITMRDLDEGSRFIHNNGKSIGFVGQHGEWIMRVFDNGDILSRTSGWLSDRINAKFDKTGGTVTGDIISSAYTPIIFKNRTSEDHWHVYSSGGQFGLWWDAKGGNGAVGNKFTVDYSTGAIWCAQFGDVFSRIETRAREWADDRAQRITARLAFAGDLFDYESGQGTAGIREPFGGAVVTGFAGQHGIGVTRLRFRYLQMKNIFDQWYTVGWF